MIDHMILNLKKYYESEVPYLVGKNIRLPEKSIPFYGDPNPYNGVGDIKNAILSIEQNGATATTTSGFINYAGTTCQVVMQASGIVEIDGKDTGNINGTYQTFVNLRYPKNERSSMPGWLCLSQILQNGGVSSSLLTHVYHAFILARKELSMANNVLKILFDKDMYIRATKGNSQLVAIGAKTTIYVSEPNNAHENIEQHNPLVVYVTSYDNNYYRIVDFNGYPFYSTHTWGGETYKDDNWLKNDATYTVKKEQVLQIGGVLRSLSTKLCGAFRKQVVACL